MRSLGVRIEQPQETVNRVQYGGARLEELEEQLKELRAEGIGCNNYFPPIHLQPFYRQRFGYKPGDFPIAERAGATALALPFFGTMTEPQVDTVCGALREVLREVRPTLAPGTRRQATERASA